MLQYQKYWFVCLSVGGFGFFCVLFFFFLIFISVMETKFNCSRGDSKFVKSFN